MESIACDLGVVTDLSAGGARVIGKRVPKGRTRITLSGCGQVVQVEACVAWSTRLGWRQHELGLEFIHVTNDVARTLTTMAMTNRVQRGAA